VKTAGSSIPPSRQALASVAVLICFCLGALLVGCAPDDGEDADTTAVPGPTTASPVEESTASVVEETTASRAEENTSQRPTSVTEAVAATVDEPSIREHLYRLTGVSPAPLPSGQVVIDERGSAFGRRATAAYMEGSFEEMGIPARTLRFNSEFGRGFNVEATLHGVEGDRHLWVTAHLDSVHNSGANDDASGLVLILLVAEALERLNLKHTIHFVAYDLEEVGIVGSSVYVEDTVRSIRQHEGDQAIIGNIQNDMVGYEEDDFNAFLGTCGRAGSLDEAFLRASRMLNNPIDLDEVCLERSDHQHFWDAGLPAVVLTDGGKYDGYPWYHEPGDTPDKLNVHYLRSVTRLVATTAALLASGD
jgi:hypothetical protein